jgi:hypothetical protein
MPQREVRISRQQLVWVLLGLIFLGTALIQGFIAVSTGAGWALWVAAALVLMAISCAAAMRKPR